MSGKNENVLKLIELYKGGDEHAVAILDTVVGCGLDLSTARDDEDAIDWNAEIGDYSEFRNDIDQGIDGLLVHFNALGIKSTLPMIA